MQTIMIRIPKDISERIDIVKALNPKQKLSKQKWTRRLLDESLQEHESKRKGYKLNNS